MTDLTRESVTWHLAMHTGEVNGIRACDLVAEICGESSPGLERQLRHVIDELRHEGMHICGLPSTGYYLAANQEELDRTCEFLFGRSINGIEQVAAMKRVSLPDLRGQLRIRLESPQTGVPPRPSSPAGGDCDNTGSPSRENEPPRGDRAPISPETADGEA